MIFKKYWEAICLASIVSCVHQPQVVHNYAQEANCTNGEITYAVEVKPLLESQCTSCHNTSRRAHGIDLSSYSTAKSAFLSDEALCSVHYGRGCHPMPENAPKLSEAQIQTLDCWVKGGCK